MRSANVRQINEFSLEGSLSVEPELSDSSDHDIIDSDDRFLGARGMSPDNISILKSLRELTKITVPVTLTQLITTGTIFLSGFILSEHSPNVFSASGLFIPLSQFLLYTPALMSYATTVKSAESFAQADYKSTGSILKQAWLIALLSSVPSLIISFFSGSILKLLGQSTRLSEISQNYFYYFMLGIPANILLMHARQFAVGVQKPWVDFLLILSASLLSLLLSYTLVLGKLGFPALGEKGYGLSLSISSCLNLFIILIYFRISKFFKKFELFTINREISFRYIRILLRIGIPISIQLGFEMLSSIVLNIVAGVVGDASLTAIQAVNLWYQLLTIPLMGLSESIAVLSSKYMSKSQYVTVKKNSVVASLISILISSPLCILLLACPRPMLSIFISNSTNDKIFSIGTSLSYTYSAIIFSEAIRLLDIGSLRGLFITKVPMYVGLFNIFFVIFCIGIPLTLKTSLGVLGIAISRLVGSVLSSVFLKIFWSKTINRAEQTKQLPTDVGCGENSIVNSCSTNFYAFFSRIGGCCDFNHQQHEQRAALVESGL